MNRYSSDLVNSIMKKAFTLLCLLTMLVVSQSIVAQEVTITIYPGWNRISYPSTDTVDFATALGSFTPHTGDMIKSDLGSATFLSSGRWRGTISQFYPGYGYIYKSTQTVTSTVTFNTQQLTSQVVVTTMEPTNITAVSAVVGGIVSIDEGNHIFTRGICWGTEPNPNIDGDQLTGDAVSGSQSFMLEELMYNTIYYVRAYVVTDYGLFYGEELSFTTERAGHHEYVDLGLPSGLLWATCNIGANAPENYGDYFAWGETQPKDYYDWSTYQYCNGNDNTITKYCYDYNYGYNGYTDTLTALLPEDDAATANWGGGWRMPTYEEWEELYNNTTCTWTTQNGVNGRLFTSSNGNSLFLPAAGTYWGNAPSQVGVFCDYWSSSLSLSNNMKSELDYGPDNAWMLSGSSNDYQLTPNGIRSSGVSVRAVRPNVPIGAINGKFTVNSDGDQVFFSQGNLQYQASTNTWRFAVNQYDYVGSNNSNISSFYSGWIDLFGWGTSGYDHGANCYQPWSTSTNYTDYYAYGSNTYNLYDQTGQADWGYKPISNGGCAANLWRTLTRDEWNYVFNTRSTTSGVRYAKAKVNNVNGVILLPDDWSSSTYSLSNTNSSGANYNGNILTASQWSVLEQAGAIFLPNTGLRCGTVIYDVGSGYYWSASYYTTNYSYYVYFGESSVSPTKSSRRDYGRSVRLVAPCED